jgi:DNA-binding NarL/FixJ family response regulator
MKTALRILVVEDEFIVAMTMKDELEDAGYVVVGMASTADKAVELATSGSPDVIMMDIRLKGTGDGVDAACRIHDLGMKPAVIFVTGSTEPQALARIQQDHPAGVVFKPAAFAEIERAIRTAIPPRG